MMTKKKYSWISHAHSAPLRNDNDINDPHNTDSQQSTNRNKTNEQMEIRKAEFNLKEGTYMDYIVICLDHEAFKKVELG